MGKPREPITCHLIVEVDGLIEEASYPGYQPVTLYPREWRGKGTVAMNKAQITFPVSPVAITVVGIETRRSGRTPADDTPASTESDHLPRGSDPPA
jgi:hypothetical protein